MSVNAWRVNSGSSGSSPNGSRTFSNPLLFTICMYPNCRRSLKNNVLPSANLISICDLPLNSSGPNPGSLCPPAVILVLSW